MSLLSASQYRSRELNEFQAAEKTARLQKRVQPTIIQLNFCNKVIRNLLQLKTRRRRKMELRSLRMQILNIQSP